MARCEDWPCCGHEAGSCPNADGSFPCICGAILPKGSRSSLCESCLRDPDDDYYDDDNEDDDEEELELNRRYDDDDYDYDLGGEG